ncbi:hypothetical protein CQW23_09836 [Capsicum baccatum]|uniref:Uncharacterized protein n=1 Tax=Capsicum baccatum TaxID=33114 RepID=A0A2G2WY39_CAPBA|nr:hypothetical protein CQW23_09836 [Capsicum baccatum]
MNVHLLKCAIHKEITPAKYSPSEGCLRNWSIPSSGFGNFSYSYGYWEWVEDVLPYYKEELELIKVLTFVKVGEFVESSDSPNLFDNIYARESYGGEGDGDPFLSIIQVAYALLLMVAVPHPSLLALPLARIFPQNAASTVIVGAAIGVTMGVVIVALVE